MTIIHKPWSEEERAIARRLLEEGAKNRIFVDQLGRTRKGAVSHIRLFDHRRDRSQEPARIERKGARSVPNARGIQIPETVLDEAAKRMSASRSITAYVFGDPPPGYSALDKREDRV